MWQERQTELLRDEIETCLTCLPDVGGLRDLVREPLVKARRGLAADGGRDRPWPLLPMIVCESISGRYDHALPATAALQFLMAACDVLDDIEDADSSDSLVAKHGLAVATNVATALLFLGEKAITRSGETVVSADILVRVMDALNSSYTFACAGQHLDLSLTLKMPVSEEAYMQMVSMKSAALIECACRVGALLGTTKQAIVDIFAAFGSSLGMAAQITNDIQGLTDGRDIVSRTVTLPIIYALTQTHGDARRQLEEAFDKQSGSAMNITHIRDLLFSVGAVHYASVKLELYKQQAIDIMSEAQANGANMERVKLFLD